MSATVDVSILAELNTKYNNAILSGKNTQNIYDEFEENLNFSSQNQGEGSEGTLPIDQEYFAQYVLDVYGVTSWDGQGKPPSELHFRESEGRFYLYVGDEPLGDFDSIADMVFRPSGVLSRVAGSRALQDQALRDMGFSDREISAMREWIPGDGYSDFQKIIEYVFEEVAGYAGQSLSPEQKENVMDKAFISFLGDQGITVSTEQLKNWRQLEIGNREEITDLLVNKGVHVGILDDWAEADLRFEELIDYADWYLSAAGVKKMNEEDHQVFNYFAFIMKNLSDSTVGPDGRTALQRFALNSGIDLSQYDLTKDLTAVFKAIAPKVYDLALEASSQPDAKGAAKRMEN